MDNGQTITYDAKESIKLVKNAKGSYQWEIKLIGDHVGFDELKRLEILNAEFERGYTNGNDKGKDTEEGGQ